MIEVGGPEPRHFDQLLVNLVRGLAAQWEFAPAMLPDLLPEAVALLRRRFDRHRSVRRAAAELEVMMAALIRTTPRRPY